MGITGILVDARVGTGNETASVIDWICGTSIQSVAAARLNVNDSILTTVVSATAGSADSSHHRMLTSILTGTGTVSNSTGYIPKHVFGHCEHGTSSCTVTGSATNGKEIY